MDVQCVIDDATVVVTGASGCLGQALVAEIMAHYHPKKLVLLSRSESRQAECKVRWPEAEHSPIRWLIGDVRQKYRLEDAFEGANIVIHAAALKRVEVCQREPLEAIETNVVGTVNVCQAARATGVERLMFISSDKAAAAATIYGGSKYLAEQTVVAMNSYKGTRHIRFSACRYGNVLGSTGSVLQTFKAANGRVPITDARMTRFWITPQGAARFILSSLALQKGGEVFCPKLPAASVLTLAEAFAPGAEHEIVGLRGIEKIHECLVSSDEAPWCVELPDRYVLLPAMPFWSGGLWPEAKKVPDGFTYTSENAPIRLTVEQLRRLADDTSGS